LKRTLIDVEPDSPGWKIRVGVCLLERNLEKVVAIERASRLAMERHRATGQPTGVAIHTLHGGATLVGLHD
jgi:hypothetical protein